MSTHARYSLRAQALRWLLGRAGARRPALRFDALEARVLLSVGPAFPGAGEAREVHEPEPLPVWSGVPAASDPPTNLPAGASLPLSSLPALASRPAATAKLFLDFDGDTVANWAYNAKAGQAFHPGTIPAYDSDGNTATFSDTERANIQNIWARVAEFYSPFNLDVTTIDPGNVAGVKSFKVDIGGNGAWYTASAGSAGGVGMIGSYSDAGDDVAFVFAALAPTSLHYLAVSIAHEAGHAFGLTHQRQQPAGQPITEYYFGEGQRAPIMGNASNNGAARPLWWLTQNTAPQFSPDAVQNELAIISSTTATPNGWGGTTLNGFGYRADDHGNAAATADAMTTTSQGAAVSASGVIEQTSDVDYFAFDTKPGTVRFNVAPAALDGMLDARLELRTAAGALLTSADTGNAGESLSFNIAAAGSYRVVVASHGGYGDVGQYTLTGQLPDRFEGNDTRAAAAALGVAPGLHIADANIDATGDDDWYRFDVLRPGQGELEVKLTSPSLASLSLMVTDADGQAIGASLNNSTLKKTTLTGLAPGSYYVRVAGGLSSATTNYALAIDPSSVGAARLFYVNDNATAGDVYATAVGSGANSGLTPAAPRLTLQSLIDDYTLGPDDLVLIDAGEYATPAVITAADAGAAYAGAGLAAGAGSRFNVSGAAMTIEDAGGNQVSRLEWIGGAGDVGIDIHGAGGGALVGNLIDHNRFTGLAKAIQINGGEGDVVDSNTFAGPGGEGVVLADGLSALVTGNLFTGLTTAVRAERAEGGPFVLDIEGNSIHDGVDGIVLGGRVEGSILRANTTFDTAHAIALGDAAGVVVEANALHGSDVGVESNGVTNLLVGNTIADGNVGVRGVAAVGGTGLSATDANEISGNTVGVEIRSGAVVQHNLVHHNLTGLRVVNATGVTVVGNTIHDNVTGVLASNSNDAISCLIGDAAQTPGRGNAIYDNSVVGVDASGNVAVTGNRVYGQSRTPTAGMRIGDGATATRNEVFGNVDGVVVAGGKAAGNRVYHQSGTGIVVRGAGEATGNQVYSNAVGIRGERDAGRGAFTGRIVNNVVYANDAAAIELQGASAPDVVNNTLYQFVGDGLRVGPSGAFNSSGVVFRNNVVWVYAGHALAIAAGSRSGFDSDYNLYRLSPSPDLQLADWGGVGLAGLDAWQAGTGSDTHGLSDDPAVPNADGGDADFVDPDGADGVLGYTVAGAGFDGGADDNFHLSRFSLAIDAADPSAAPAFDKDGQARRVDPAHLGPAGPAEIGAYEFLGSRDDATPPTVVGTPTMERVGAGVRLHVTFSEPIDPIDARAIANYRLIGAGPDGLIGGANAGDDLALSPTQILFTPGSAQVTLDFGPSLGLGQYRLEVSGLTSIHDLSGHRLDGDADGEAGGNYLFDLTLRPPEVTGVLLKGSTWSASLLSYLSAHGLGDAGGYAVPVGSGAQLAPLPWTNLDQITIRFNVPVTLRLQDLLVRGVNLAAYSATGLTTATLPDGSFEATWTLSASIGVDKILISLSDTVSDAAGNALDGEWSNPASSSAPPGSSSQFASGNGAAGAAFLFRFNVAPGDANQNGGVNVQDTVLVRNRQGGTAAGAGSYSPFNDVNGNGGVNVQDVVLTRNQQGKALPAGEPALPAAAKGLSMAGAAAVRPTSKVAEAMPSGGEASKASRHEAIAFPPDASTRSTAFTPSWRLTVVDDPAESDAASGLDWLHRLASRKRFVAPRG